MCKICQPILGPYTRAHKESECPLSQAAYCSRCGTNRHFKGQCTFKSKQVPFQKQAISSVKADTTSKTYALANTNEAYVEYNRLFNQPIQGSLELNKETALAHMESRGFILEQPPPPPIIPKRRPLVVRKSAV